MAVQTSKDETCTAIIVSQGMQSPTQKQIDKMPAVSLETLAATRDSMRNYLVYIGETCPVMLEHVHVGFGSSNHLDTIREVLHGQPIYMVRLDTRPWKR